VISKKRIMLLDRALDVVGDRWSLLIVRELMIKPCRYTDLREALSGIATNLLAYRLRDLEIAGVIGAGPEIPGDRAPGRRRSRRRPRAWPHRQSGRPSPGTPG
jgi:hypothetical protein